MDTERLRNLLIQSLMNTYRLPAINTLTTFLQGEDAVLFCVDRAGIMTPSALSAALKISKGRVTVILNALLDKEYVDLNISSQDRRNVEVNLTEKGKAYFSEKKRKAERYFDLALEKIGVQDARELIRILNEINTGMEDISL